MGTDAGGPVGYNFQGYNTIREMELLVEAGLSPMDVMVAATRTGAELIGIADRVGTLAPGKLADFLVLEADPLADIRNVRRVRTVVLGGVAHPRSAFDARTVAVRLIVALRNQCSSTWTRRTRRSNLFVRLEVLRVLLCDENLEPAGGHRCELAFNRLSCLASWSRQRGSRRHKARSPVTASNS